MREILASKITAPRLRRAVVVRPRLTACLNAGLGGQMILVSAPAGYGKSTLVADWLGTPGSSVYVAWLSLDPEDSEPGRFLIYLAAAVERAVPHLSQTVRASFDDEGIADGVAFWVLFSVGFVMCAVGPLGQGATYGWWNPLHIIGYVVGAVILLLGAGMLFDITVAGVSAAQGAIWVLAGLMVVKGVVALFYRRAAS